MTYTRVNWQNNISTPINADHLNIMDLGINDHEGRIGDATAQGITEASLALAIKNDRLNLKSIGHIINVLYPPASLTACVGDNVADDTTALQAIINYAQSNNYSIVYMPLTTNGYKLSNTITIDHTKIWVIGYGAVLNFSNDGIAIKFASSNINAMYAHNKGIQGLELVGTFTTNSIGIQFSDATGNYASNLTVYKCKIHEFKKGINWSNNSWVTKVIECELWHCDPCVYFPTGLANAGEGITFDKCAIFNATSGIYNAGCQMRFNQTSIDYINYKYVECALGGFTTLNDCHVEGSTDYDYWLYTSGVSSTILMKGGSIAVNGTRSNFQIGCGTNTDGGVHLRDVQYIKTLNGLYNFQSLIVGWGSVRGLYPLALLGTSIVNVQGADTGNYLSNGGCENASIDDWTSSGTANTTYTTAQKHSGTSSQQFHANAGQYIIKTFEVSLAPTQVPKLTFYLKTAFNNSNDIFSITAQYVSATGLLQASTVYTKTYTKAGGDIDWTLGNFVKINPTTPCYPGYTKCRFTIAQASAGTPSDGLATFYIDDLILTVE